VTKTAVPQITKNIITSQPIVIPVFHEVAIKLLQMMNDNSYTIEEVSSLIHEDQALSLQMIKQANSTFNSGKSPITTIKNAIIRLGAQQIVNLAFSASMSHAKSNNPVINAHMVNLYHHSCAVAKTSAYLALKIRHDRKLTELNHDEVYLAGLLHDVGKLYILKVIDNLIITGVIHPNNSVIEEVLLELNIQEGIKVLKHYNMPEIYSDVLSRLDDVNWKNGSNDYFVASVRLSNKLHNYIEHDIDISDSANIADINDEMLLLDVYSLPFIYNLAKAITV